MSEQTTVLPDDVRHDRVSALEQAGGLAIALATFSIWFLWRWMRTRQIPWLVAATLSSLGLAGLFWLYRTPSRPQGWTGLADQFGLLWPADGRLVSQAACQEPRFLGGPALRLVISVPAWGPQVVWAPGTGTVAYRRYEPASRSAEGLESLWLGIVAEDGQRWLMRWVASPWWQRVPWFLARRIVCWPDLGDPVQQGEIIGHLPLGGRIELYTAPSAAVAAQPGRCVAGRLPLATSAL